MADGSLPKDRAAWKSVSSNFAVGITRRSAEPVPGVESVASATVTGRTPSVWGGGSAASRDCVASATGVTKVLTTTSTGPSRSGARSRREVSNVSPTSREPVIMAVPSALPSTTSTASPLRRAALRTAKYPNTGQRSAANPRMTNPRTAGGIRMSAPGMLTQPRLRRFGRRAWIFGARPLRRPSRRGSRASA